MAKLSAFNRGQELVITIKDKKRKTSLGKTPKLSKRVNLKEIEEIIDEDFNNLITDECNV